MSINKNTNVASVRRVGLATVSRMIDPGEDLIKVTASGVLLTLPDPTSKFVQNRPTDRYDWSIQCGPFATVVTALGSVRMNGTLGGNTIVPAFARMTVTWSLTANSYFAAIARPSNASVVTAQPWFIDPSNTSKKASPVNDGATPLTPLSRFTQMFQRWGTSKPLVTGALSITLMSNGILDGTDSVDLEPVVTDGGSFILDGTLQSVAIGTFGVVTAQNRTGAQRYQATVTGGMPANWWSQWVGKLLHDTVTDAWFWVLEDNGAQTATLTRPKASSIPFVIAPALLTINNGDSFVIYDLPVLDLIRFAPTQQNFATPTFTLFPCQVQHIRAATDPTISQSGIVDCGTNSLSARFVECHLVNREPSISGGTIILANCFSGGPVMFGGFCVVNSGVISASDEHATVQNGTIVVDGDAYIDDHILASQAQIIVGLGYFQSRDAMPGKLKVPLSPVLGDTSAGAGATLLVQPYYYGQVGLWGPASVECSPGGEIVYQGTAIAAFLNTGGLKLDGSSNASSYDGAGGWNGGIALTPANLDAAAGAAGFGGCAYGVKGSKIHQWV